MGTRQRAAARHTTVVSWLPFDGDMGLMLRICAPVLGEFPRCSDEPRVVSAAAVRWIQLLARNRRCPPAPTSLMSWWPRPRRTTTWSAWILRHVLAILDSSERIHPASVDRFTKRFARFNLPTRRSAHPTGCPRRRRRPATRRSAGPPHTLLFASHLFSAGGRAAKPRGTALISYGIPRSPAYESSTFTPELSARRRLRARSGCTATTWHGGSLRRLSAPSAPGLRLGRLVHPTGPAANGLSGLLLRRRAIHHGQDQGSLDRGRLQSLSGQGAGSGFVTARHWPPVAICSIAAAPSRNARRARGHCECAREASGEHARCRADTPLSG